MQTNKDISILMYVPPKSNSHGHAVRDKNIKRALRKVVDAFISNLKVTVENEMQITIYFDKKDKKELLLANNTIFYLTEYLGKYKTEWINPGYEYFKDSISWEVKGKDCFDLLDYLDQINQSEILPIENFWISNHYSDRDEAKLNTLILTTLMCSIESGRLFVRFRIMFPYIIDDERLFQLLEKFNKELPFKLSSKHFRKLGLNRDNKYGHWKLDNQLEEKVNNCLK